jgi:hypothetical protein
MNRHSISKLLAFSLLGLSPACFGSGGDNAAGSGAGTAGASAGRGSAGVSAGASGSAGSDAPDGGPYDGGDGLNDGGEDTGTSDAGGGVVAGWVATDCSGSSSPTTVATFTLEPGGSTSVDDPASPSIAVDDTYIYFGGDPSGALLRMKTPCAILTELASGYGRIGDITIDDSHVYFSAGSEMNARLYRVPKSGGDVQQIAAERGRRLTVANGKLFWLGASAIRSTHAAGGSSATSVVTGVDRDTAFTATSSHVLYEGVDGEIYRVAHTGGAATRVDTLVDESFFRSMDDEDHVFYEDRALTAFEDTAYVVGLAGPASEQPGLIATSIGDDDDAMTLVGSVADETQEDVVEIATDGSGVFLALTREGRVSVNSALVYRVEDRNVLPADFALRAYTKD